MTQSDIGIVEKLKAKTHCAVRVAGGPEFVNPDGPEAAAIITEMVEALEKCGSALDDWIRIVDIRAPLNPDLKHYFWKRDPTWDEVQEAMRVNNKASTTLAKVRSK